MKKHRLLLLFVLALSILSVSVFSACQFLDSLTKKVTSITVESADTFYVGDDVTKQNFGVTAVYSDNSTKKVSNFQVDLSGFTSQVGTAQLTFSYTERGVEVSATKSFQINALVLQKIEATYTGGDVELGENIDEQNVSVIAFYNNGVSKSVTNYTLVCDISVVGEHTATVKYTENDVEKTTTFSVVVVDSQTAVSLKVTHDGTTFVVGEAFRPTTLTVEATFADGHTEVLNSKQYSYSGFSSQKAGTVTVTVTFCELSQSVEIQIVEEAATSSEVSVHFLELGNKYTGDSVFIKAGDADILIDAGSRKNSGATVSDYIGQYCTDGILEYVIVTHAHQDHIAGFVGTGGNGVFANYKCENIIEFSLTNSSSAIYSQYVSERNKEVAAGANFYLAGDCFNEVNGAKREFQIADDISLEILYNYYYFNGASSENDYSVCVMLHHGEDNYLFTGDLESGAEKKMVEYYQNQNDPLPHCVLYKAGHHGSKTSSSDELMAAITPEYVCVCCCAGSSEYTDTDDNQFPTQEFINRVAPYTDNIYVTTMVDNYAQKSEWGSKGTVKSMNGNIVFTMSGGKVTMKFSGNDLKLKDTEWFKAHRTWPQNGK